MNIKRATVYICCPIASKRAAGATQTLNRNVSGFKLMTCTTGCKCHSQCYDWFLSEPGGKHRRIKQWRPTALEKKRVCVDLCKIGHEVHPTYAFVILHLTADYINHAAYTVSLKLATTCVCHYCAPSFNVTNFIWHCISPAVDIKSLNK